MTGKHTIALTAFVLMLLAFFVYILFSRHGYFDLAVLYQEQSNLIQKNEQLTAENLDISIEIDRLENDPLYIENIARQELGMISKDEIILKPLSKSDNE